MLDEDKKKNIKNKKLEKITIKIRYKTKQESMYKKVYRTNNKNIW